MLNFNSVHPTWQAYVNQALQQVDPHYIERLIEKPNWLPGAKNIFNAFTLPFENTRYILFGESPYPRPQSANGYAFWDANVKEIWSPTGLSKQVNRATSLRHLIKMMLVAEGLLDAEDTSQVAISQLDKQGLVQTLDQLFGNFLDHGFLLLNASLVLGDEKVAFHAQQWRPFLEELFRLISENNPHIELILLGNIAKILQGIPSIQRFPALVSEHPYNISFVTNPKILKFFKPLHLLKRP